MIHPLSSEPAPEQWPRIQLYQDLAKDQPQERAKTVKTHSVTRRSLQQVLIQQVLQFHQLLVNQLLSILLPHLQRLQQLSTQLCHQDTPTSMEVSEACQDFNMDKVEFTLELIQAFPFQQLQDPPAPRSSRIKLMDQVTELVTTV